MSEVTVVAVADKNPTEDYLIKGFSAFNRSLYRFGHHPLILGWAAPWRGLGSKPKLLKKAIEDGWIQTEYIIFADAFDTFFAYSPDRIVEHKKDNGPGIVFGAERTCFPEAELAKYHPETQYSAKYLNSGLSVGKTSDYLQVLTEMEIDSWEDDHQKPNGEWVHRNDQHDWMVRFLFGQCLPGQVPIELDQQCYFFQNLHGLNVGDLVLDPNSRLIVNTETRTLPMVLHANGPFKTHELFLPILSHLDLL